MVRLYGMHHLLLLNASSVIVKQTMCFLYPNQGYSVNVPKK